MHPEEKDLIESLKAGDGAAFRQVVETFKDKVYNSAIGIVQNEEDAEDIAQEVFIAVHRSIHSFKGDSSLSTWIYRITLTRSLDHLRKQKRQKRWAIVKRIFQGEEEKISAHSFHHPGVQLENKEKAAVLFSALSKLPETQRAAFTLHHVEELSHKEISEVMNVTTGAVESLLHRAKQNLRKHLSDYYKNE